jgi:hypothetical protein
MSINNGHAQEDPFANLESLRLDGASILAGTVEHVVTVPVKKPLKTWFFRAHSDPSMYFMAGIWSDPDERDEIFFVHPSVVHLLDGQTKPVMLATCITRQGTLFLWPVPMPTDARGGSMAWGESTRQAVAMAVDYWIRLQPDMQLGAYKIIRAEGDIAAPTWPNKTMSELLRIAFGNRIIQGEDHPVVRRLRGLA